jgi:tetratricopeptide (TPR) repeat protein
MPTRIIRILPALAFALCFSMGQLGAQEEESPAEAKYRQEYERIQKIVVIPDVMRRGDQLFQFMKADPDPKLTEYAHGHYIHVLEELSKAQKFSAIITLSEKYIAMRPRVGETYYYYGAALKSLQKYPEAMKALAKCTVLKNPASRKAREFLEFVYKSQNKQSLIGLEKLIKQAESEIPR